MPVRSFVRQRGAGMEDAEGLTRSCFCHLLDRKWFSRVDPNRGRLRSYLSASLSNFPASAHAYAHAGKRAGDLAAYRIQHRGNWLSNHPPGRPEPGPHFPAALGPWMPWKRRSQLTRKFHREQRLEAQVEALFTRQRDPEDKGPTSASLAQPIRDLPGKGPPDPPSDAPKLCRGTSFMKSAKPSGPTTPGKSGRNSAPCCGSSSRHDSQRCRSAGPSPACGYP